MQEILPGPASTIQCWKVRTLMDGLDAQKVMLSRDAVTLSGDSVLPRGASVLLSGGSGMLGTAISRALVQRGVTLLRLVRRSTAGPDELQWDPAGAGVAEPERLEGLTAAVHLSGANVAAQRWTAQYKREMGASRVKSTAILAGALARLKRPPQVLVMASAIGFYGDRGDEVLAEDAAAGQGFFPELCAAWEAASRPAEKAGIRVAHLRFGMVAGKKGGAIERLAPVFRMGLGGRLGNGRQWVSWVHEEDAVAAALFALGCEKLAGPVNVTAPEPVRNAEFTRELAQAVHRPAILPVPAFGLRLIFGEMANEALLASARVIPRQLQQAGFVFAYPRLRDALAAIFAQGMRSID